MTGPSVHAGRCDGCGRDRRVLDCITRQLCEPCIIALFRGREVEVLGLPRGAILALPHVKPYPGTCWTEIVTRTPPNAAGRLRSYPQCIQPLLAAGLIAAHHQPNEHGGRNRLFYRTKKPAP